MESALQNIHSQMQSDNMTSKEIMIAAKFYEVRDTIKGILMSEYHPTIKPFQILLKDVMELHSENALEAMIRVSKVESFKKDAFTQMMVITAMIEIIEPSK